MASVSGLPSKHERSTDIASAYMNGKQTWLSEEVLNAVGGDPEVVSDVKLSTGQVIGRVFGKFSKDRIAPLFATKRLGIMSESKPLLPNRHLSFSARYFGYEAADLKF